MEADAESTTDTDVSPSASVLGHGQRYLVFNAPLSLARAERLVALTRPRGERIVDLGCGKGELLLRLLASDNASSGTGIDSDPEALERATQAALQRGLAARARFLRQDAESYMGVVDIAMCVGASSAFGGHARALRVLANRCRPGGRVVFGDTFWQVPGPHSVSVSDQRAGLSGPPPDAPQGLPLGLAAVVRDVVEAGLRPVAVAEASLDEWDEYETVQRLGLERYALEHKGSAEAAAARTAADRRLREYLETPGYRGRVGFSFIVALKP